METNQPNAPENETDSIAEYHNNIRQIELEGYTLGVRKARNALYWTAALVFLGEIIAMFTSIGSFNVYVLIVALFEAGIFVALALWTRKKPHTAIVFGLVAFIGIIILSAAISTYTDEGIGFLKAIFGGFVVKIIILVNLVKALNDAKALQDAGEEKS